MRNTSLTPAVQARICEALKAGNTRRAAAVFGGINEATFYEWLKRGTDPEYTKGGRLKAGEAVYAEFAKAVTQAEADCEVWHVANVKRHATDDWRASIEWLKRRKPSDWSESAYLENVRALRGQSETAVDGLDAFLTSTGGDHVD